MVDPKPNPVATITNSLDYDVDIYDVFTPDAQTHGPSTYTKLTTVAKGVSAQQVTTKHFASQLQAMRTGNIPALNNFYYLQFPVAVLAVSTFSKPNAFTLTSDMQQSLEDSFKFIKYTQANASSQLAKSFRAALCDKTSQQDAVDKFFQSSGSFKKCTMSTWTAVMSWQAQFTNPWQGTYYLYSLGSSSTNSTKGPSGPVLRATLVITASATDEAAKLTMEGTADQNTAVVMGGDGNMQEQNQGTGNLSVFLTPTWLNIAQTGQKDGKTVLNYVIGAAFTGTINGEKVTGTLNKLVTPTPAGSSSPWNGLTIPTFSWTSLSQLVGMLTGIAMVYYMAKGHKMSEVQKKNDVQETATDAPDAAARESRVEQQFQTNDVNQVVAPQRQNVENTLVPQVRENYNTVSQAEQIRNMGDVVAGEIGALQTALQNGAPSQDLVNSASDLDDARDGLEKSADPTMSSDARSTAVSNARSKLDSATVSLNKELLNSSSNLSEMEKKAMSDAQDAVKEQKEEAEAREETDKSEEVKETEDPGKEVEPETFEAPKVEIAP